MEVVALIGWLVAIALGGAFAWVMLRVKQLETTLSQLADSKKELTGSLQKAIEDRDQTVKRVRRDADRSVKFGHEPVLKGMLPVLDNLERAVRAADEDLTGSAGDSGGLLEGVRMVSDLLRAELARHGVTPIESEGERFDPKCHEAIQRTPSDDHRPGIIMSEWQRGYRLYDRLLRPARVVVASDPLEDAIEAVEAPEE